MRLGWRYGALVLLWLAAALLPARAEPAARKVAEDPSERHTYYTGGVHNEKGCLPPDFCSYPRKAGDPTPDPLFPQWWTSDWVMYRVFNPVPQPPPYTSPPSTLKPSEYETSYGTSYYDATYRPADGDGEGAMMEHYDRRCLPIFPSANTYSCSFVSLGNKAYFLRYADRPPGTPTCCQFSLKNHPPRPDFIRHLPYSPQDSARLDGRVQAYARIVKTGKDAPGILFAYAFEAEPRPDATDQSAAPYRHPQSFYFSGYPLNPPDAPIVSQNYTNFSMRQPDPARTWEEVARMCPAKPEWCCLFADDCPSKGAGLTQPNAAEAAQAPEWSNGQPD